VRFSKAILAPGSRPAALPGLAADGEAVLDSDGLLEVDAPLESLIVVGGGAIGLEMADFHHRLGARVTVVEAMDRLAPTEDPELCAALQAMLKRKGWDIRTGARVAELSTVEGRARLRLEDGTELAADKALLAVGRHPNTAGIGLEALGAQVRGAGWIATDGHLLAAPDIYAVGDANGRTLLAHTASHQGRYAARHAAGATTAPYDPGPVPACVYGSVELMRAGPTAGELQALGRDVRVSRSMLAANPMAQAHGAAQGMVKAVWSDGRLQGVSAVGHNVSHLVTQSALAAAEQWTPEDVDKVIFAHPSLDESLEAALRAPAEPA
jgi:dihydrolipoamide dehydrogenase